MSIWSKLLTFLRIRNGRRRITTRNPDTALFAFARGSTQTVGIKDADLRAKVALIDVVAEFLDGIEAQIDDHASGRSNVREAERLSAAVSAAMMLGRLDEVGERLIATLKEADPNSDALGTLKTHRRVATAVDAWHRANGQGLPEILVTAATQLLHNARIRQDAGAKELRTAALALNLGVPPPNAASGREIALHVVRELEALAERSRDEATRSLLPRAIARTLRAFSVQTPDLLLTTETAQADVALAVAELTAFSANLQSFADLFAEHRAEDDALEDIRHAINALSGLSPGVARTYKKPRRSRVLRVKLADWCSAAEVWSTFVRNRQVQLRFVDRHVAGSFGSFRRSVLSIALLGTGGSVTKESAIRDAVGDGNVANLIGLIDLIDFFQFEQLLIIAALLALGFLVQFRLRQAAMASPDAAVLFSLGSESAARRDCTRWLIRLVGLCIVVPGLALGTAHWAMSSRFGELIKPPTSQDDSASVVASQELPLNEPRDPDSPGARGRLEAVTRLGGVVILVCHAHTCPIDGLGANGRTNLTRGETVAIRQSSLLSIAMQIDNAEVCVGGDRERECSAMAYVQTQGLPPKVDVEFPKELNLRTSNPGNAPCLGLAPTACWHGYHPMHTHPPMDFAVLADSISEGARSLSSAIGRVESATQQAQVRSLDAQTALLQTIGPALKQLVEGLEGLTDKQTKLAEAATELVQQSSETSEATAQTLKAQQRLAECERARYATNTLARGVGIDACR